VVAVPDSVTVDLADVTDAPQLHARLKAALGFPDWYGANWDALWDTIAGLVQLPPEVVFTGWAGFAGQNPEAAGTLRRILDRYEAQRVGSTRFTYR
jgi:ribonuclease inhibitor